MDAKDVEVAWGELDRARREGSPEARSFGEIAVPSRIHVGDGATFFCHVMESVAPGRWEFWRLGTAVASGVFAVRVGASPSMWLDAGAISLDSALGAFIPDAAADEIQALDDDEITCDFAMDIVEEGLAAGERREAILRTPGGAALAAFRLGGPGSHAVSKGLDGRGQVCVLAILS